METLRIFDTTLRDGEQAPGFSMNMAEKLELARQLARLRVDVIEAGFPASSPDDFESVQAIARTVGTPANAPVICALARCHPRDIERTAEALAPATNHRIHAFLATSDLHLEKKLRMSRSQALDRIKSGVRRAREFCPDVEFTPEDASRTDFDFLCTAVRTAIDAGASTINIPDTVGYAVPEQWGPFVAALIEATDPSGQIVFSTHCHDDLGLAMANTMAAVSAGVRQVECTLNGIGERAGNAALEEIVMILSTRQDAYGLEHGIDTRQLGPSSRLLSHITAVHVPPNKAIVGRNAFRHEAGIHQHGLLSDRQTYEILRPADVGVREEQLVLGKHSGRHALSERLHSLGFEPDEEALNGLFLAFKELCAKKRQVFDSDLLALVSDGVRGREDGLHLSHLHVVSGTDLTPTATVRVELGEDSRWGTGQGDGPVDASLRALEAALNLELPLKDYSVRAASPGSDAQGEVSLALDLGGHSFVGRGSSTDTVEATALALVDALDRALAAGAWTLTTQPSTVLRPVDAPTS